MLNIVIPMAGKGSRFAEAGFTIPKPLLPIHGVPMIKAVMDNLAPQIPHRFILICQSEHIKLYDLETKLKSYSKNVEIIGINEMTEGQVCTVLKASHLFNNDEPLMTANSDQFIDFNIDNYLSEIEERNLDGLIMTMKSNDPKWSYAKLNNDGLVTETAEKKVISNEATVGIYNFKKGSDLVRAAEKMIADNVRVNNEFYTCPCFNYLIAEGKRIGVSSIGEEYNGMYGLGIPKDLEFFINHPVSRKVKAL